MVDGADEESKTEEASGKRVEEAREQGNVPISREMSAWFLFIGLLITMKWFGPGLGTRLMSSLRVFIEKPEQISLQGGGLQDALMGIVAQCAFQLIALFGLLLCVATLGTMLQTGFYIGTGRLEASLDNLMPSKGLKRLFSSQSLSELVKSFFKFVVLGYVCFTVLHPVFEKLPAMTDINLIIGLGFLHKEAVHLIIVMLLVITVFAVADLVYVRHQYFKTLRMTKQEVKDEHKQLEGDPMIKARIRALRIDRSRRRMMAKVPKASVIITNPTHYAVALEYDGKKMSAPVLVAKGLDRLALRIRELGEEHEVPIVSNPPLARTLHDNVDLDQQIQPEHYKAVAEIISYVYKLKKKK